VIDFNLLFPILEKTEIFWETKEVWLVFQSLTSVWDVGQAIAMLGLYF
jgi:hypothetical protein